LIWYACVTSQFPNSMHQVKTSSFGYWLIWCLNKIYLFTMQGSIFVLNIVAALYISLHPCTHMSVICGIFILQDKSILLVSICRWNCTHVVPYQITNPLHDFLINA
jgi:hypothetical protein